MRATSISIHEDVYCCSLISISISIRPHRRQAYNTHLPFISLHLLPLRHLLISPLDLRHPVNHLQPLRHTRVLLQPQPSEPMLLHPRIEVQIHRTDPLTRKNEFPSMVLNLCIQNAKAAVSLLLITLQGVFILARVVVAEPVDLACRDNVSKRSISKQGIAYPSSAPKYSTKSTPTSQNPQSPARPVPWVPTHPSCRTPS